MNSSKISQTQRQLLIEYLKDNNQLLTGKFSNTFTYKDAQSKWEEITSILNSHPGGARKDWKGWRKTWQDIRSRTKGKVAKNKKNLNATGGGPYTEEDVSPHDQEVLQLINPVSIQGHSEVQESSVLEIREVESNAEIDHQPGCSTREWRLTPVSEMEAETQVGPSREVPKVVDTPSNTGRSLQKRGGIKLKKTTRAVDAYEAHLKRKLEIKEEYYSKKLKLKEDKNEIARDTANSLRAIAESFTSFVENM